jgi:uncharacterized cupin superfamily protein
MTQANFLTFDISGIAPEYDEPPADRLISGTPKFRSWNLEDRNGTLYAGVWEATPGKWRIAYEEWEYVHMLDGRSIITEDGGAPVTVKAGDSFVIRPGFTGTWEVVETTRKQYVIKV